MKRNFLFYAVDFFNLFVFFLIFFILLMKLGVIGRVLSLLIFKIFLKLVLSSLEVVTTFFLM